MDPKQKLQKSQLIEEWDEEESGRLQSIGLLRVRHD